MMRKIQFFIVLLLFFNAFQVMSAQTCKNYIPDEHPDSRYTVHNNGTVTDTQTGLMWKVCSEGQTLNNGTCSGTAATYTWQTVYDRVEVVNAQDFAGHNNWRVPDIKELTSLAKRNCYGPAINELIFPNTPNIGSWYWSSSPLAGSSNYALLREFYYGKDYINKRSSSHKVRLVRYAQ